MTNDKNDKPPVGPDLVDEAPSILKNEEDQNTQKTNNNQNINNGSKPNQGTKNASFTQTPPPIYQNYQGQYNNGYHGGQNGGPPPGYGQTQPAGMPQYAYNQKKSGGWGKGLMIFGIIVAVLIFLGYMVNSFFNGFFDKIFSFTNYNVEETYELPDNDFIARIAVEGEITANNGGSYLSSGSEYDHQFTLDAIDDLIQNDNNKALLLFVDTPGGGVYESDQLYLKIKQYQDETQRPVYVAMGSMAASGGYYISAPADMIYADRNCWTGSIGVTMGTHFDISKLLKKYGIKAENLTSGDNKAMGSAVEPLTKEQRQIYQGLLDDAYNQFVGLIAEGRGMNLDVVKTLADGRIYTARQAEENGLIDGIATEEEVTAKLRVDHNLQGCDVENIESLSGSSWLDEFFYEDLMPIIDNLKSLTKGDLDTALSLTEQNDKMPLKYLYEQ